MRVKALDALRAAFKDYIKVAGLAIIMDEEKVLPCATCQSGRACLICSTTRSFIVPAGRHTGTPVGPMRPGFGCCDWPAQHLPGALQGNPCSEAQLTHLTGSLNGLLPAHRTRTW